MIIVSRSGFRLMPSHACVRINETHHERPLVTHTFLQHAFHSCAATTLDSRDESLEGSYCNDSSATHFVANGEHGRGPTDRVIPLLNTNANLYTVVFRHMPINLPSSEVRFDHFRRLTLWTCTVSLRNLRDILIAARNLRYFVLGGWTSLTRGDNDDLMEATICSSLRHIHVNCADIQYVGTDWLNPRDERNAQLALLRFLERAHVTTPTRLDDIVLKLSIKDVDAAAKLIDYSLDTLEYLTLEYVDSPVLTSFINLDGTKRLREVHIKCAVDRLYEIVYSLRTISSSWLEEIHLHVKVFTNEDRFHALSSFDMDVYQGRFPTLLIFGVHVDPWSSEDDRVFRHHHIFRKNVMMSAAYLREAKKLKYFWGPDENRDLSDVFLLETEYECREGEMADDG